MVAYTDMIGWVLMEPLWQWSSEELVQCYRRDGYVAPIRVVSESVAHSLRDTVLSGALESCDEDLLQALLAPVKTLIDGPIQCVASSLDKADYAHPARQWHQDAEFFPPLAQGEGLSVTLALSDMNSNSGAVRILPGSHRQGCLSQKTTRNPGRPGVARIIELQPGEITLQHGCAIHRAPAQIAPDPCQSLWFVFVLDQDQNTG